MTLNSRGLRFVGDHVGEYDDGDLVLLGPNLPHTWASREAVRDGEPHVALVLWFDSEWAQRLTAGFVEFRQLDDLLARARRGVQFSLSCRPRFARSTRASSSSLPSSGCWD